MSIAANKASTERLGDLPEVSQLGSVRHRIHMQAAWPTSPREEGSKHMALQVQRPCASAWPAASHHSLLHFPRAKEARLPLDLKAAVSLVKKGVETNGETEARRGQYLPGELGKVGLDLSISPCSSRLTSCFSPTLFPSPLHQTPHGAWDLVAASW